MLDRIFKKFRRKDPLTDGPDISFGRYSDNNKSVSKVNRWTEADTFFKDKKYPEGLDAFFDYLGDDAVQNVSYERNGAEGRFQLFQGSKIVRGNFDKNELRAEVMLATMPEPSVPVMRRLLEMNFGLYYSRYALDKDRLCMRFDSDIETASPSKLYYGLKELGTKADKQDDLLIQDFASLKSADDEHIIAIPQQEKNIKYDYFQKWIQQTLDTVASVDADKFSGGISYLLLTLIYKIDYLISPEGKLLHDLEKIAGIYFKKDDRPVIEKNRDMTEEFKKLQKLSREEAIKYFFRSKYTFSIVAPQQYKTVADSIAASVQNMLWYRDNNYPYFASQILEYGIAYCQYSYSLPKAITELFHIYMMVNHADYFSALGFKINLYDPATNRFDSGGIIDAIQNVREKWKEKHPLLNFKTQNLRFDTLINFNSGYVNELGLLNMEGK